MLCTWKRSRHTSVQAGKPLSLRSVRSFHRVSAKHFSAFMEERDRLHEGKKIHGHGNKMLLDSAVYFKGKTV